ncbi:MAG TPA: NAD(P)/FAD-dependent oxidoreductase, partial [Rhodothermales bacterium]|nr:NAD(P)/FAD-dependent oxidoreductase [Rhodothermales bacterium]
AVIETSVPRLPVRPPAVPPEPPHVVILGAGFAGLEAAKTLAREPVRVTIVDRQNYHGFQPLYYQVATAGLEPGGVAHSVRDVFHAARNVDFRMGEVVDIDRAARRIAFADGTPDLEFDALIVAAGAETAYYGVPGAREHALPLKRLPDATRLRNHVLERFEAYSGDPEAAGEGALTFVIVGGGATGVELAGAFTELFRIALRHDYKAFDTRKARVMLLDQGEALLAGYPDRLREYARRVLVRRGVEVRLGVTVARVEADGVVLKGDDGNDGERIPAETIVWAAGVEGSPVGALLWVERVRGKRIPVEPDLRLPGDSRVFVVGDLALVDGQEHVPQQAQPAQQMGIRAARNVLAIFEGGATTPFRYGSMATIGRNAAVAMLFGRLALKGLVAWLAWVFVHLMRLVGFRNRAMVFVSWVYDYFTYDRSARLILETPVENGPRAT